MSRDYVINVMSVDRVGIVSGLSEAIVELGGNIEGLSQTVLRGYFTIIVTAHFKADVGADAVAHAVRDQGGGQELAVQVKERDAGASRAVVPEAENFILTITGRDRPGIILRMSSYLSSRNINIADLYATAEAGEFLLIAQIEVPAGLEVERVQMDVHDLWPDGDVRVTLQHENIFLATGNVDFRHSSRRRREAR